MNIEGSVIKKRHPHYYKSVEHLRFVDVYRVLKLFNVTDPSLQHAIKKLLVAGERGAGKDIERDLREAIDSINRSLQMIAEDDVLNKTPPPPAPSIDTSKTTSIDQGPSIGGKA